MRDPTSWSRRHFLGASAALALTAVGQAADEPAVSESIIDIHQHLNYAGRSDDQLLAHQRRMGVTHSVLLPAGTPMVRPSTHNGKSNGLAAQITGCQAALEFANSHPKEYFFFANEVADADDAPAQVEKYLKLGALGIGEQKFGVDCDSIYIQRLAELAQAYNVPILLHFQFEMYNLNFERFWKVLEKYPRVNFIGHAQTWWANIDKNHIEQKELYPKTKVTPGGITDRYLRDYPNMYGDMSAGSGLNAMMRDEDQAREFLKRHQDKLMYGSDCDDKAGTGPTCSGSLTLIAIRRLAGNKALERKILYENARRVLRLDSRR